MPTTGIHTQSATSILEDVDEFYFGGVISWFGGTELTEDKTRIKITLADPEEDEGDGEITKVYELSANQIKQAFVTAREKGYHLCCAEDITSEQLGYGCVQDLDIILQTAAYGELIFG